VAWWQGFGRYDIETRARELSRAQGAHEIVRHDAGVAADNAEVGPALHAGEPPGVEHAARLRGLGRGRDDEVRGVETLVELP
jgi:hypothetical protein